MGPSCTLVTLPATPLRPQATYNQSAQPPSTSSLRQTELAPFSGSSQQSSESPHPGQLNPRDPLGASLRSITPATPLQNPSRTQGIITGVVCIARPRGECQHATTPGLPAPTASPAATATKQHKEIHSPPAGEQITLATRSRALSRLAAASRHTHYSGAPLSGRNEPGFGLNPPDSTSSLKPLKGHHWNGIPALPRAWPTHLGPQGPAPLSAPRPRIRSGPIPLTPPWRGVVRIGRLIRPSLGSGPARATPAHCPFTPHYAHTGQYHPRPGCPPFCKAPPPPPRSHFPSTPLDP
jgi:hypothetical protein